MSQKLPQTMVRLSRTSGGPPRGVLFALDRPR
jgi:hypothetical protein